MWFRHQRLPWMAVPALVAGLMVSSCASPRPTPRLGESVSFEKLGTVQIDPTLRRLIMTGYVNQVEGAIELVACGTGGKTHESIFVLYAKPNDIQTAMLLLGFKHGPPMPGLGMGPPSGDEVQLHVYWREDGEDRVSAVESLIFDFTTKRSVRHGAWIFNGSKVENGYFLANAEDSLIASYWDPWAIINIQSDAGSDDTRLAVDRKTVPPLHTPITFMVSPGGQP